LSFGDIERNLDEVSIPLWLQRVFKWSIWMSRKYWKVLVVMKEEIKRGS